MLETAMWELGYKINAMADYVSKTSLFRLFKLHGSVNWGRIVNCALPHPVNTGYPPAVLRYLIENPNMLVLSDEIILSDSDRMGFADGRAVFPAIAIPVEKKQEYECPSEVVIELTAALPSVTNILMVGWRASENHFLNLLKENLRPQVSFFAVVGSNAEIDDIRTKLYRTLINKTPNRGEGGVGFTSFLRSRLLERVLSW
jgi:hypothetical protein